VISDDPRFLFVHIPKTAGKSIAYALNRSKHPYCLNGTKHEGVESFVARVSEDVFRSFNSFNTTRALSLALFLLENQTAQISGNGRSVEH
jgi:hypothetical protein